MATLVGGSSYLNPYESIYNSVKNNSLFKAEDFEYMNKTGKADQYLGVMMESKNLSPDTMNERYKLFDNMDSERRVYAIANELDPEARERVANRTLSQYDSEKGEYIDVEQEMSDYDYTKYLLDEWAQYEQAEIDNQAIRDARVAEQAAKDTNVVGNIFGTIASPVINVVEGATDFVSNIGQFFGSLFGATGEAIATGDWDTWDHNFRDKMTEGYGRVGVFDDFKNWLIEFESKYSYARDLDGNLTSYGAYISQTFNSIGNMLPSFITGSGAAKLFGKIGKAGSTINKVATTAGRIAVGTLPYYISMWDKRMYEKFADPKFNSTPTGAIVAQTAIASVLDAAVEYASGAIFGGTGFEAGLYGVSTKAAQSWSKRIFKNFIVEGGEEAVQEFTEFFSGWIFSFAYDEYTNQDFGIQNMIDAFIMGGLSSVFTNGFEIMVTNKNVTVDENGKVTRYSKAASWNQNTMWSDLMQEYNKVLNNPNTTDAQMLNTLKSMYGSFKVFGQIYKSIGTERITKANDFLKLFTEAQRTEDATLESVRGAYTFATQGIIGESTLLHGQTWSDFKKATGVKNKKDLIAYNEPPTETTETTEKDNTITTDDPTTDELINAMLLIPKTAATAEINTLAENGVISKQGADTINKVKDATGKDVVILPEGNQIESDEDTIGIPDKLLDKMTPHEIMKADHERKLATSLLSKLPNKFVNKIVKHLQEYINKDAFNTLTTKFNYTNEQLAMYYLLYDESFYNIVLYSANQASYQILSVIDKLLEKSAETTLDNKVAKQVLENVRNMMVSQLREYLIHQQTIIDFSNLTMLSQEDINYVYERRRQKNFYNNLNRPKYEPTEADANHWNMLVNGLVIDSKGEIYTAERKAKLKEQLHASYFVRLAALSEINESYNYVFTTEYNDKIYFKSENNVSKAVFNQYLVYNDLTLEKLSDNNFDKVRQDFELYSGGNYTLVKANTESGYDITNNISDTDLETIHDYNSSNIDTYMANIDKIRLSKNTNTVTLMTAKDAQAIIQELVNTTDMSELEIVSLRIDDIIKNPNRYLKASIKQAVMEATGVNNVTEDTAFLYLQDYLNNKGNSTVYKADNGTYVLANFIAIQNVIKKSAKYDYKENVEIPIINFVNEEYLVGDLKNIKVIFRNEGNNDADASYHPDTNTIVINTFYISTIKNNIPVMRVLLLHEFTHAIQNNNGTLSGFDPTTLKVTDEMIADFEQHIPYIAELKTHDEKTKAIKQFIYFTSIAEMQAFGMEGSGFINFMPTILSKENGINTITTFWGDKYTLTGTSISQKSKHIDRDIDSVSDEDMTDGYRSRYVSNEEALKSNLRFYIRKNKPIQLAPETQTFVKKADRLKLEPVLWRGIYDGVLDRNKIMNYFREHYNDMNEYTFNLINKSFFRNSHIKSAKDVDILITRIRDIVGIVPLLRKNNLEDLLGKKYTITEINTLVNNFYTNPKLGNAAIKTANAFFGNISINNANYLLSLLEHFDGTFDSLYKIANLTRSAEMRRTQFNKNISIDAEIEDKRGYGETSNVADRLSSEMADIAKLNVADDLLADYTYDEMLAFVVDYDYANNYSKVVDKKIAQDPDKYTPRMVQALVQKRIAAIMAKGEDWVESYFRQIRESELIGKRVTKFRNTEEYKNRNKRDRKTIVAHTKSLATQIVNNLTPNEFAKLPDDIHVLFDENGKLKSEVYVDKSPEEIEIVENRLKEIRMAVREGIFSKSINTINKYLERLEKLKKANDKLRDKLKKKQNKQKIVNIKITDGRTLIATSIKEYPAKLVNIMNTAFDKMRNSDVKFVSSKDDKNMILTAKEFYTKNDKSLTNLTNKDVKEIIAFYSGLVTIDSNEMDTRRFKAFETYVLAYILEGYNTKHFNLDLEEVTTINNILRNFATNAGTELAVWRSVLDKINPLEQVVKSLSKRYGLELSDEQESELTKAANSGDIKQLNDIYKKIFIDLSTRESVPVKRTVINKILKLHKAFMLSNIGTAIRNKVSNVVLYEGNKAADFIGALTSKLPGKFKHHEGQYNLTGVKVSQQTTQFVKTQVLDSGLLDLTADGLTRYDIDAKSSKSYNSEIVELVAASIAAKLQYGQKVFSDKNAVGRGVNKLITLIFKMQSDDRFINKTAISYFGRIIESEHLDTSQGMTAPLLNAFADSYSQAAIDYMRKPSFFSKLEQTLGQNTEIGYFVYKLAFPFMSAGWNWFKESLTWTPAGIIKGIQELVMLERIVDKLDYKRSLGEQVPPSRFVEMMARRKIGKGIIGTTVLAIGAILGAVGVIRRDDDDKLKLYLGNLKVDLSSITGITSLYIGAALTTTWDSEDGFNNFMQAITTSVNLALDDLFIKDIMLTVRYNSADEQFGIIRGYGYQILQSFVPNILKSLSKTLTIYEVKYAPGFLGQLQKYITSWIPGTANALEKKVDIYTGEPIAKNFGQVMLQLISQLSPIKLSYDIISDIELEAMSLGINKSQLSGNYNFGELDVEVLNKKYGELNNKALNAIINDEVKVKVKNANGTFSLLKYSQMTPVQKENAITTQMQKNSTYAKVYIWTQVEGNKYYASDEEFKELRKLGIVENVYHKTLKNVGFIK